ncbi:hypothetical protein [Paraburkholderia diazotrophica]|uniref:hypothetical protein n=1 Tax=Paraburkholderia diazotrophica TaxID=667676 RepID=UPI0031732609
MNSLLMLNLQFNHQTVLSLDQVCTATGYKKGTAYKELSSGLFPIPMRKLGKHLVADVRDVAGYLEYSRADTRNRHSALWQKMELPRIVREDDAIDGIEEQCDSPSSLFPLLGRFDCAVLLSLDQVCDAIGYRKSTAYAASSAGTFPIPMRRCGKRLYADVRDVASHLDAALGTVERARVLGTEAYALLSMRFGSDLMDLDTVCQAIAWEKSTAYNATGAGTFPVFMRKFGRSWMADPRDVGFYLDEERERLRRPSHESEEIREELVADDVCTSVLADEEQSDAVDATSAEGAAAESLKSLPPVERQRSGMSAQETIRAILERKARRRRK